MRQPPHKPLFKNSDFVERLRIPVIGSPMFIVSSKELVARQCCAGIVGAFPALNARPQEELAIWLDYLNTQIATWNATSPPWPAAPYAVNLIVHPSNERLAHDLDVACHYRVPVVITSLNAPGEVVDRVHSYGGIVIHDISSMRHAHKAIEAGVDGLILVCAGAGGHTGTLNPFAFTQEVRRVFDGLIAVAGCITQGQQVLAVQAMGADLAYVGTRFIASNEAQADQRYQDMIVNAAASDIVCTNAVTGLPANYLRPSFMALGMDVDALPARQSSSFGFGKRGDGTEAKAWRDVWSAGQGVGGIESIMPVLEIVNRLATEYASAVHKVDRHH
ncbi:nitronate monooxygenase family protein [Limnohabitans sp. Rim11]|uniref:NAD(P)H-dependent flavin oxidoreductase n=1 Tax=Limnohabitans sp. Rim11 TaxID=1100719 RepID=UPI000AECD49B|nr:nitronate monooxygenase family protein [Limnohabitans sp. Rim11]